MWYFLQKFLPARKKKYRKRLQVTLASKLTSGKNRCLREHSKFNAYPIKAMKWYASSKENIIFQRKNMFNKFYIVLRKKGYLFLDY